LRPAARAAWVLVAAWVAAAVPALASPEDDAEAKRRRDELHDVGKRFYDQANYLRALEAFEQAYAAWPNPNDLLSQASAHKRLFTATGDKARKRKAIELYRAFLATDPPEVLRKAASDALDALAPLDEPDVAPVEPPAVEPPKTTLAIDSSAEGAMISVDGGAPGPAQLSARVEPGPHKVRVTAPGYTEREVVVEARPNQITPARVDLEELDGRLHITGGEGFVTWVDGVSFGRVASLTLSPGPHFVSVTATGRLSQGKSIRVDRGGSETISFDAPVTTQRWVGVALTTLGGAALVGGLVTIGLAVDRDARAAEIDEARRGGSISIGRFEDYQSLQSERDTFRASGIATLATGAALGVLGLSLVLVDRPDPLPPPPTAAPAKPAATPLVEVGLGGTRVSLSARF